MYLKLRNLYIFSVAVAVDFKLPYGSCTNHFMFCQGYQSRPNKKFTTTGLEFCDLHGKATRLNLYYSYHVILVRGSRPMEEELITRPAGFILRYATVRRAVLISAAVQVRMRNWLKMKSIYPMLHGDELI